MINFIIFVFMKINDVSSYLLHSGFENCSLKQFVLLILLLSKHINHCNINQLSPLALNIEGLSFSEKNTFKYLENKFMFFSRCFILRFEQDQSHLAHIFEEMEKTMCLLVWYLCEQNSLYVKQQDIFLYHLHNFT